MATFNQQNQRVAHQVNADTVNINRDRYLLDKIDNLIAQAERAGEPNTLAPVIAHLSQAREASARGDTRGAVAFLREAAGVAAPIAAIAASLATLIQGVQ